MYIIPQINTPPDPERAPYQRPDISLLRSIIDSSDQIRAELKVIGDEGTYVVGLRVLKTQGELIAKLASALLVRFEKAGEE